MARMTQSEIVNTLADSSGLKKADVKGMFDAIAELAVSEVRKNGEFTLPGFGKLVKAAILRPVQLSRFPPRRPLNFAWARP